MLKALLSRLVDKLQETFPPNRVAILLAGVITAVSGSIAAWIAAHVPGVNLGSAEIAGVLGAAVIVTVRLLDRWFDRWQEGERVDYQADFEDALGELADSPDVHAAISAIGTFEGVSAALADLRVRVENEDVGKNDVTTELGSILDAIGQFLHDHPVERPINAETPAHHPV
jgi:hypothetical protein